MVKAFKNLYKKYLNKDIVISSPDELERAFRERKVTTEAERDLERLRAEMIYFIR